MRTLLLKYTATTNLFEITFFQLMIVGSIPFTVGQMSANQVITLGFNQEVTAILSYSALLLDRVLSYYIRRATI